MPPPIVTVRDHITWSYANLGRADAALKDGLVKYSAVQHMIRSKLFKGLKEQTMEMSSLYRDERLKMTVPQVCYYLTVTKTCRSIISSRKSEAEQMSRTILSGPVNPAIVQKGARTC